MQNECLSTVVAARNERLTEHDSFYKTEFLNANMGFYLLHIYILGHRRVLSCMPL